MESRLTSVRLKASWLGWVPLVALQDGNYDRRDGEDGTDYPYNGSDIEGH